MTRPLNILHISAELAPLISTGGLADVVASLPPALRRHGHDVRVAMPCYASIPAEHRGDAYCMVVADLGAKREIAQMRIAETPTTGVPLYLIEHDLYFGRRHPYGEGAHEYGDNAERFAFFCLAVLDGIPQTGWVPDIIHCHDWHAAPAIIQLKSRYANHPHWAAAKSVITIHNLAYQGRYGADMLPYTGFDPSLFHPGCLEYHGDLNMLKGALILADSITTVSPRYAREIQTMEYGEGLEGVLQARSKDLTGILNGIDFRVWNPREDRYLPTHFSGDNLAGKDSCKAALQEAFGLPREPNTPLFGIVSRLVHQKGIDLVTGYLDRMMEHNLQLAVLGTGDSWIEHQLLQAAHRYPERVAVQLRYDSRLAHLVQGGSDFFLMPSRYEPCGLSQMYAFRYGAIPIVRRTGGLADSVVNTTPLTIRKGTATGLVFVPATSDALLRTMRQALRIYADKPLLAELRQRVMGLDFSWDHASLAYERVYTQLTHG